MRRVLGIILSMSIVASALAQEEKDWRLYKPSKDLEQTELQTDSEVVELSSPSLSLGQTGEEVQFEALPENDKPAKQGEIRYIQDERISVLDEYLKSHPIKHDGYRIQLIFGSREVVSSAKSRFVSSYNYYAYEDYLPPNFRLRVGDFLTRFQAEKVLREINGRFPKAYIVRDKIAVPREFR